MEMSWTAGLDKVAHWFQNLVQPAPKKTSYGDVIQWAKKVFTITWIEQPQNVYNLIAFASALIIIYLGIKYSKEHIK